MAFLDNSGDIILDAVLTDLGRKRMAQGNFKITKFAFGDDEIQYTLFNKDHPSGSAYYDLEILQTPVFEAFTATNANINYGLMSYTRDDLLYLPAINTNELMTDASLFVAAGVYYIAANVETSDKISATGATGGAKYVTRSSATNGRVIIFESGLDTTELAGTATNQKSYITAMNLYDNTFKVYYDNRFISNLVVPTSTSTFSNSSTDGSDETSLSMEESSASPSTTNTMDNYSVQTVAAIKNQVYYYATTIADTTVSAIKGPRGTACALNFTVLSELSNTKDSSPNALYSLYGSTGIIGTTVFGAGSTDTNTYDYIDTTVYVVGGTSTNQIQLPIRIIRLNTEA